MLAYSLYRWAFFSTNTNQLKNKTCLRTKVREIGVGYFIRIVSGKTAPNFVSVFLGI